MDHEAREDSSRTLPMDIESVEGALLDWEWDTTFENMSTIMRTSGKFVRAINPSVSKRSRIAVNARLPTDYPVWQFSTEELRAILAGMLDDASAVLNDLPSVPLSSTFPYRDQNGERDFVTTGLKKY